MRIARPLTLVIPGLVAVGLVGLTTPALAASTPAVVNGTCTKGSLSNLQVQREDNGTLSIDFGVDMARHTSGVPWTVRVTDNGALVARTHTTTISDGSFSVTRVLTPKAGANHVVATARNSATGERCVLRAVV